MTNDKLAEIVKELRKQKGLSQEELASKSGLSLRTIQRIEKNETEPTGATLNRISNVFNLSLEELIIGNNDEDELKKTIKTKHEYLHVFDDKLIISKMSEFDNPIKDYNDSLNNLFKSMIVFLIAIPIFTILATMLYDIRPDLSFQTGSTAFFFLTMAIYAMFFTSGSPLIYKNQIEKISMEYSVIGTSMVIKYRDKGRLKIRVIMIEKDKIHSTKKALLEEVIFRNSNLKFSKRKFITTIVFSVLFIGMGFFRVPILGELWGQGAIILIISGHFLVLMIKGFYQSHKWKKENNKPLVTV